MLRAPKKPMLLQSIIQEPINSLHSHAHLVKALVQKDLVRQSVHETSENFPLAPSALAAVLVHMSEALESLCSSERISGVFSTFTHFPSKGSAKRPLFAKHLHLGPEFSARAYSSRECLFSLHTAPCTINRVSISRDSKVRSKDCMVQFLPKQLHGTCCFAVLAQNVTKFYRSRASSVLADSRFYLVL